MHNDLWGSTKSNDTYLGPQSLYIVPTWGPEVWESDIHLPTLGCLEFGNKGGVEQGAWGLGVAAEGRRK